MPEQGGRASDPASDPVSLARAALAAARAARRGTASGPAARQGSAADPAPTLSERQAGPGAQAGPGGSGSGTAADAGARHSAAARDASARPGLAVRPGFAVQPPRSDPEPLSAAIGGLLDAEGWTLAAATGSVFGRWAQIVGGDLAAHTTPERLADGELTVTADSTAWATQLRLLAGQLVKRLNAELGDGTVLRVKVKGPITSARQPGQWRVRGSRGPRDTYG